MFEHALSGPINQDRSSVESPPTWCTTIVACARIERHGMAPRVFAFNTRARHSRCTVQRGAHSPSRNPSGDRVCRATCCGDDDVSARTGRTSAASLCHCVVMSGCRAAVTVFRFCVNDTCLSRSYL